ncbi:hypothetical protein L1987_37788 [Smallanthus sonchifolius]|uniref:Uncharacterized protein n=1 Tax=Smallanthus sonchifolius TaxID=185202 RepID=A0ACB9HJ51_9ASTR|nr:hypothetical protein L1987_37788 [Smallanthus sonchifolius]
MAGVQNLIVLAEYGSPETTSDDGGGEPSRHQPSTHSLPTSHCCNSDISAGNEGLGIGGGLAASGGARLQRWWLCSVTTKDDGDGIFGCSDEFLRHKLDFRPISLYRRLRLGAYFRQQATTAVASPAAINHPRAPSLLLTDATLTLRPETKVLASTAASRPVVAHGSNDGGCARRPRKTTVMVFFAAQTSFSDRNQISSQYHSTDDSVRG